MSSGTMELVAIQRSLYFKVSHLTSQYAMLRCDHHVVTSHGPPSLYLRFPIPNYGTTYLLNGLMKWSEHIQKSQTIGLMKRSRCEWDWTYPREAWTWNRTGEYDSPNLFTGPWREPRTPWPMASSLRWSTLISSDTETTVLQFPELTLERSYNTTTQ